ncbi:MAG: hypothetical protein AAGE52_14475 [Myxococcota bacterium]
MKRYAWIGEPVEPWNSLAALPTSLKEASALLRHILREGQVLESAQGYGFVDEQTLAVLFSFAEEERRGADIVERYADYGELGALSTEFGEEILRSAPAEQSVDPTPVIQRFEERMSVVPFDRTRHTSLRGPSLLIGRDFS